MPSGQIEANTVDKLNASMAAQRRIGDGREDLMIDWDHFNV